jgi:8-oxo-dGTP pyrophosphatase MutT (NUDIX family)
MQNPGSLQSLAAMYQDSIKRLNKPKKYSAGCLYYCPDDNTVLLVKRSGVMNHPHLWDIPGGRSDSDDQTAKETAVREATEELGELPEESKIIKHHVEILKKSDDSNYEYHIFIFAVPEKEKIRYTPKVTLDEENIGIKWFDIDELPANTHFNLNWIKRELGNLHKAAMTKFGVTKATGLIKVAHQTLKPRYEHKYYIPLAMAYGIREFIRPYVTADDHGLNYTIRNIYLDNDELEFFADHMSKPDRFKLRARSYSTGDQIFLEIKRKSNGICSKFRSIVPFDVYDKIVQLSDADDIPFVKLARQHQSKPIVMINYDREAYNTDEADGRITIDSNVRYVLHNSYDFDDSPHRQLLPPSVGILELKFTGRRPIFMTQLIKEFDLDRNSISKYCMSISEMLQTHELAMPHSRLFV